MINLPHGDGINSALWGVFKGSSDVCKVIADIIQHVFK